MNGMVVDGCWFQPTCKVLRKLFPLSSPTKTTSLMSGLASCIPSLWALCWVLISYRGTHHWLSNSAHFLRCDLNDVSHVLSDKFSGFLGAVLWSKSGTLLQSNTAMENQPFTYRCFSY